MKKTLLTVLFFAFKAIKSARGGHFPSQRSLMDLAKLKASLVYVKSIETFRLIFMSMLTMGISMVCLIGGLILFHTSLFLYSPWSAQVKLYVGLAFAVIYLAIAVKSFSYVFSESQWLKIFHAADILDDISGPNATQEPPKRNFKESGINN